MGGYLQTQDAKTLGHLRFVTGVHLHYDHQPLRLVNAITGTTVRNIIGYQLNAQPYFSLGLLDWIQVGIIGPVTLVQSAEGARPTRDDIENEVARVGGGFGDIWLIPKFTVYERQDFRAAVTLALSLPTGSQKRYLGDASVQFLPRLALATDQRLFSVALNLAYRLRQDQSFEISATQGGFPFKMNSLCFWRPRAGDKCAHGAGCGFCIDRWDRRTRRGRVNGRDADGGALPVSHGASNAIGWRTRVFKGVGTPRFRVLLSASFGGALGSDRRGSLMNRLYPGGSHADAGRR